MGAAPSDKRVTVRGGHANCIAVFIHHRIFVVASSALGASQRDDDDCKAGDPDRSIAGCARILQDRGITTNDRIFAYTNRANAYRAKGDYGRTIADYNDAIRLDPKDAVAYGNRGLA